MKFKFSSFTGARNLENGRKKRVEKIEIVIDGNIYQTNEEVEIAKGQYQADVNVIYTDGLMEVIKNQSVEVDGRNKKVILDMKSPLHRLTNLIFNYKFYASVIIAAILIVLFGEIGGLALIAGLAIATSGSDYYYKRDGFDKTFRAVIK